MSSKKVMVNFCKQVQITLRGILTCEALQVRVKIFATEFFVFQKIAPDH